MPIYKKVNKNFFKHWSYEMAYVLGFFMADGSMDINPRGAHYFSFQICDRELLEQIRRALRSEHKLPKRRGIGNERDSFRLQIASKDMCSDLKKLGIHEKKTRNLVLPRMPVRYFNDFLRGYFDGDGNVWIGTIHKERKTPVLVMHTVFTSCSKTFLENLHRHLMRYGLNGGGVYCK